MPFVAVTGPSMRALLQRVLRADVSVDGKVVGDIDQGLLILLGVQRGDTEEAANKLLDKIFNYRVFSDEQGKMNLSVKDIRGGLLIVSQFTLAADTKKGLRPGFSSAAEPSIAKSLYEYCLDRACLLSKEGSESDNAVDGGNSCYRNKVASGIFGADMQVSLVNDGPVTFLLEVTP